MRDRCRLLLEHMIDLEFAKAGAGSSSDLQKQKQAVIDAKHDEFLGACTKTPRTRVECAIAAITIDDVAKCDGG